MKSINPEVTPMNQTESNRLQEAVFNQTQALIDKHGARLAGTKPSLDCADDLYQDALTFADTAHKEDFHVFRGAFLGWIRLLVFNYAASLVLLWLNLPLYAAILALTSLLVLLIQFVFYMPMLDRFYPKRKARNVYGIIEPEQPVETQIIVSGHHDSARIFNFYIHQPGLYNLRTTGSIAWVVVLLVMSVVLHVVTVPAPGPLIMRIVASAGFLLVGQMWFFASRKGTSGAGDNLVASVIAWQLGRYYQQQKEAGHGLQSTRLIFMSFDAEEEGLRGARAYAKAHARDFERYPTYLLNADCLYDEKDLFFLTSDINNTVKLSDTLAQELADIAKSLGLPSKTQPLSFLTGGTDAAELAKKGVKATTAIGMPWTNAARNAVYHTPEDTLDKVSPSLVGHTLMLFSTWIDRHDSKR